MGMVVDYSHDPIWSPDYSIEELEHLVHVKGEELRGIEVELEKARSRAHPFKVGQEVEAYTYVTAKRRWDWQKAKIATIRFYSHMPTEYKVFFSKKDGTWSIKPRYTSQVRLPE